MKESAFLYQTFYQAEDRFRLHFEENGFEHEVVFSYIQATLNLASWYGKGTDFANPLLEELFLRRVYYNLLDTINGASNCRILRQICLDQIHGPLIALKRHYCHSLAGYERFLSLQKDLQNIQYTTDL
ncbi:hypothetical protein HC752_11160 [Vibrio sp. S9_S30]|uniref:hypothetical protein n=1 Tax=Vibrio sp. S9_S30 TaxID=2720226 RepID=UPI00167FFAC2|nr:hypothetical protein [Vibrio sp. S9_S30]MBD1557492.1 hypothetical protein [Vibrio sp. S9_S30]